MGNGQGILLVCGLAMAVSTEARQFTVVFNSPTLPANAAAVVQGAGGKVITQVPEIGVMKVEGPTSLMVKLGASAAIQSVGPTMKWKLPEEAAASLDITGADLYDEYQWDIKQVTDDGASYSICSGSHETVVAVIDTGINTGHEALTENLLGGANFVPEDPYDPSSPVDPNALEDQNGHGSHTAGAVAANGRILGVGPSLGLRAYRVLTAEGWGWTDWIVKAMVAAANDHVDVISMSLGGCDWISGYTWTDPASGAVYKFKDVADFLAWKRAARYVVSKGVVFVAAAGNDAVNIANPKELTKLMNEYYGEQGYYIWGASRGVPSTVPGVLTISATDRDSKLASYSNFGPGAIDLSAPGGDAPRWPDGDWWVDMCFGAFRQVTDGPTPGPNQYAWMAGTSMATPKAAGVAALLIDQAKAAGVRLTPAQVTAILQQRSLDFGKRGYDPFYGYGMVNAVSALTQK